MKIKLSKQDKLTFDFRKIINNSKCSYEEVIIELSRQLRLMRKARRDKDNLVIEDHHFSNTKAQRDAILIPKCPHCGRTDFPHWSACKRHVKYCTAKAAK